LTNPVLQAWQLGTGFLLETSKAKAAEAFSSPKPLLTALA